MHLLRRIFIQDDIILDWLQQIDINMPFSKPIVISDLLCILKSDSVALLFFLIFEDLLWNSAELYVAVLDSLNSKLSELVIRNTINKSIYYKIPKVLSCNDNF